MVLVDTSVWINHFHKPHAHLGSLLDKYRVALHPHVMSEIACGTIRNRINVLRDLAKLPRAQVASHLEFLGFLEAHQLYGRGLGLVDVHLLASCALSGGLLLSEDKRLAQAAADLELAYDPTA